MEKENIVQDNELEVEAVEDTEDEDDYFEEYDFNDENESYDGEDAEEEAAEAAEVPEDVEEPANEGQEHTKSTELTAEQQRELTLLHELGYEGSYEEAVAKFEQDQSQEPVEAMKEASPAVDYEAKAKAALEEINRELGLELKDFSEFEDLGAFAELSMQAGISAVNAFKATNPKFMEKQAMKAAMTKLSKPQRTVASLPKSDGGKGGSPRGESISAAKLAEYKQMFPGMSSKDIIKLIERGKRSIR